MWILIFNKPSEVCSTLLCCNLANTSTTTHQQKDRPRCRCWQLHSCPDLLRSHSHQCLLESWSCTIGPSSIPNSVLFFGDKYGIKMCRDMKIQHLGNTQQLGWHPKTPTCCSKQGSCRRVEGKEVQSVQIGSCVKIPWWPKLFRCSTSERKNFDLNPPLYLDQTHKASTILPSSLAPSTLAPYARSKCWPKSARRPVWKCWKNASDPPLFPPCNCNMYCLRMAKLMCSNLFKLVVYKKLDWTSNKTKMTSKIPIWKWKLWALPQSSKKIGNLNTTPKVRLKLPGSRITSVATIIKKLMNPLFWGCWLLLVIYQITGPFQLYGRFDVE